MRQSLKTFIGGTDAVWLQAPLFQKGLCMRASALLALLITAFLTVPACTGPPADPHPMRLLPFVAAPGSGEPHLSQGPGNTVIMSWLEPSGDGVALRYATLDDDSWSRPTTVASGDNWFVNWADFPSVEAIDGSLWASHWLVKAADGTYEYDVAVSISTDSGKTWGEPVTPHTDGTLSEHGFVTLYPDRGGTGALWLDGRDMATRNDLAVRRADIGRRNRKRSVGG